MAKDPTFDELFTALEEKARKLEQGNLGLEASVKLYEEGAEIVDRLRKILEAAELHVRTIQNRLADDEAQLREVEADYDAGDD
jgi:exodeoxyribonuclease VII small subunit